MEVPLILDNYKDTQVYDYHTYLWFNLPRFAIPNKIVLITQMKNIVLQSQVQVQILVQILWLQLPHQLLFQQQQ